MDRPDWAPASIDLDKPSAARVYDYSLGGCHNFAADREVAEALHAAVPDGPLIARANRAFLRRAVRYLVDAGIRQFLDIGSGVPTVGNVHEVAQRAAPDARVVYVDIDPVAVAHSQAILAGNDLATAVRADARHPETVLAHRRVRELLDFTATPLVVRDRARIARLFGGLELVDPGLVWVVLWRPDSPEDLDLFHGHPERCGVLGGVARTM